MLDDSTALAVSGAQLFPILRAHGVEPFEYRGAPAFLPRQVAAALGYATPKRMLSWLANRMETAKGTHRVILASGELSQVKGLSGAGFVGGRTSSHETILLLPGLVFILDETRTGAGSPLRLAYRAWRESFFAAAFAKASEPAAPIPAAPKQIAAAPADQLVAIVREGTPLASVFTSEYLTDQLARAKARERATADREREQDRAAKAESRREMRRIREERADKKRRPVKTTLW